jgi:hypothetical protein
VKSPLELTVPPVVDHVTLVFDEPVTVAVNCRVAPEETLALVGEIVTATTPGALTVTVAEADLVVSATLVAVTV